MVKINDDSVIEEKISSKINRVGDYAEEQVDWGPTLDEADVEGMDLLVEGYEVLERGFGNVYVIYLKEPIRVGDGEVKILHTGSDVVGKALERVTKWPAFATFRKVRSAKNPKFKYWTVS